jgi:hypothetical protein
MQGWVSTGPPASEQSKLQFSPKSRSSSTLFRALIAFGQSDEWLPTAAKRLIGVKKSAC